MRAIRRDEYAGRFDEPVWTREEDCALYLAEEDDYRLPGRELRGHKYSFGRALLVAGSRGYAGAAALAANACERGGAGLTQLMVPASIEQSVSARCDGAVVTPLAASGEGRLAPEAAPEILRALEKAQSCAAGPGLGTGKNEKRLVFELLERAACPLVLDADALTACAAEPERLDACRAPLILTPHEGEFRRMGGELGEGRLAGALRFTRAHPGLILILKGYGTLICRDGEAVVNPTGGPALAKGGSGDVLCGILTALLAQGFEPWFAARCAVWLHGRAGDLAAETTGEYSLAPSDIIRALPGAFLQLQKKGDGANGR